MSFLVNNCALYALDQETIKSCDPFSCGHDDLDDFFNNDTHNYSLQLLGKSYCFRLNKDTNVIVCAFTVSNSSIKIDGLPNRGRKIKKEIPREKQLRNYPAVLIGRLGVNTNYRGKGIGSELMDFIKLWFVSPQNKTGCRFVLVDAYNTPKTIKYYQDNGFDFIFSSEKTEKEYYHIKNDDLKTRSMYFDLIRLTHSI
jgi:Acetyltransferases